MKCRKFEIQKALNSLRISYQTFRYEKTINKNFRSAWINIIISGNCFSKLWSKFNKKLRISCNIKMKVNQKHFFNSVYPILIFIFEIIIIIIQRWTRQYKIISNSFWKFVIIIIFYINESQRIDRPKLIKKFHFSCH